jgi:Protein of unknown function (DUF1501)
MTSDRRFRSPRLVFSRRTCLRSLAGASLVLPGILSELAAADDGAEPLAAKEPHFPAKAKRVIFIFSSGGVSHLETFDFKPELMKADGKMTGAGGGLSNQQKPLVKPRWEFRPGGQCGTLVSDLFPHLRQQMDDICVIRSMKSDDNEHYQATLAMHTGSFFFTRPSIGAWLSYGLGTMNQNLPSFMVIAPFFPYGGGQVWGNDFLPAYHQGTRVVPGKEPIPNLQRRSQRAGLQELELDLAEALNKKHLAAHGNDSELAARIKSFETAYRMQSAAPEALDISQEPDKTLALYGLKRGDTESFGWQCLVARRLAERGVRFVELIDRGASNNWDSHNDMAQHEPLAKAIDQPIAGLLQDLRRRGMLDETLVVWTTEFGRTPGQDGPTGRGHHGACFSSWLAGGGVQGGITYGETDEIGAKVAANMCHVHDFHATILHLMGIDHTRLTYRHAGRDFRLTDVEGNVLTKILA